MAVAIRVAAGGNVSLVGAVTVPPPPPVNGQSKGKVVVVVVVVGEVR